MNSKVLRVLEYNKIIDRLTQQATSEQGKKMTAALAPMTDDVYACFRRLIAKRPTPKVMQIIDDKCGFFYLNEKGMPLAGQDWANRFNSIWEKFTKVSRVDMPKVTAHVCRHTFCSEMLRRGMSPKVLQNLMGHKDISTTMNTYAHSNDDDAEIEMRRVANAG